MLVILIVYLIIAVILFHSFFDHPQKHLAIPLVLVWPVILVAGLILFSLGRRVSEDGE